MSRGQYSQKCAKNPWLLLACRFYFNIITDYLRTKTGIHQLGMTRAENRDKTQASLAIELS